MMATAQSSILPLSTYRYQSLDLGSKQIRLVKIGHQAAHSDTPKCTIQIVDLTQKPIFRALSYVWGSEPTHLTYMDGQCLYITKNLLDFLQTVQTDGRFCESLFFIDQLCIDQSSDQERNHQVFQMSEVYASAKDTIAWLGLANKPWEGAQVVDDSLSYDLDESVLSQESVKILEAVCSSPYWSRLWIIQEVMLGQSVFLLLGQKNVMFYADWEATQWLRAQQQDVAVRLLRTLVSEIGKDGYSRKRVTFYTWQEIVMKFTGAQCKLPHDKIYGMLGIVYPPLRVRPDYRKSLQEVYEEIMEAERVYRGYTKLQCRAIRRLWAKYLSLPEDVV